MGEYPVAAEPAAAASQYSPIAEFTGTARKRAGAAGVVEGATAVDAADSAPLPAAFTARTMKA